MKINIRRIKSLLNDGLSDPYIEFIYDNKEEHTRLELALQNLWLNKEENCSYISASYFEDSDFLKDIENVFSPQEITYTNDEVKNRIDKWRRKWQVENKQENINQEIATPAKP